MKLLKYLPQQYVALGRLDKPAGAALVFLPCAWAAVLASGSGVPHLGWLGVAGAASLMLRAAGCTANDWWDRSIDRQVRRTQERPLASGALSTVQAAGFFLFNLAPLPVAWSLMGTAGQQLIVGSLPLLALYPLAKRVFNWPQAVLGLAMNYGLLVNYVFLTNSLDLHITLPLYFGAWCWTMVYDTIYAFQDKEDDQSLGIGSTALRWGADYKKYCAVLTAGCATGWGLAGYVAGLGWAFYPFCFITISHITHQWNSVNIQDPADCWAKFQSNKLTGALLFLSLFLGKLTKDNK